MTNRRPPWYRNHSVWGWIGTAVALTLTFVAVLARDFHWVLIVVWPFACLAVWSLVRSVFATRGEAMLATTMCSLLVGLALVYLHSFIKPDGDLRASDEQALLQVRSAVVPTSRNGSPALNISFYNAGKYPATNVGHYYTLATAARILSPKEVKDIQDRALGFLKLGQSSNGIDPGQPDDSSLTVPENPGEQRTSDLLARDLDHVLDGSRLLYLVVDFSYRDRTTPENSFRISESCWYFTRTLQSGHACGRNGASLEKIDPSSPAP